MITKSNQIAILATMTRTGKSSDPFHSRKPLRGKEAKADDTPEDGDVLCKHCRRTAINGIRCLGMCVADSDY
ncbi:MULTISPECIES: hypothetical protein [Prochlorococcus]|uniref:hypothetical protein n=1 Tax=Prochlorococcus TaxID=1218 RepID=UPI000941498E|nr:MULTISPECIES: hypothetical protein [Prochlorococcus]NMP05876.1 hypothetical protein [Prochlorococcus sp. P1361]NMP12901.1 hypothetical protein [Prochlorococcus sp.P1363]